MIKVSDYIIRRLEETGTGHMFMLPGGGAMHLNDSLGRSSRIKYVCCLHEQACAIAAEAYARVTDGPGLLMVTTGPGGTNALTGVAGAYLESTPVFVLSGQVKRADMINNQGVRQQGMQELDIVSVVKPVTKYAALVDDPQMVRYHVERALYEACHGRKGPVWLDIPLDVQAAAVDEEKLAGFTPPADQGKTAYLKKQALQVMDLLNRSERPVLLAGNGIRLSGGIREFEQLVDALGIPVLTTWNGIDLMEESHPLYYGRPGGLGHRHANFIQQNSDFFISIGARLNLLQTGYNFDGFAREAVKVMVDIDRAELHKTNVRPDMAVCADAREFMELLLEQKERIAVKDRGDWLAYCGRMKKKYPVIQPVCLEQEGPADTYALLDGLSGQMAADDVFVAGSSGSCIDISMQAFRVKKGQRVFTTKGLASMGYGLPSAIGACLASGGKRTVCVNGDGGFQMNIQELHTLKRLGLPVKVFVLCNRGYGAIYGTQTNLFRGHYVACNEASGLTLPDTDAVARAYGLRTETIACNQEIKEKVRTVLAGDDPVICSVQVPISLGARPKQVSYQRPDGQMESLPLEYMTPVLEERELEENMLIPLYEREPEE